MFDIAAVLVRSCAQADSVHFRHIYRIKFGPYLRPYAMQARHSPSSSQSTRSPMSMRSASQQKADAEPPAAPEEWNSPRDVHGEGNVSQAVSLFQHWFRSCHIHSQQILETYDLRSLWILW